MTDGDSTKPMLSETRNWAMACHLIALSGLLGNGIGFLVGPLVVWLVKREQDPFIDDHGKEAVNFQITMFIAMLVCIPLIFIAIGLILLPLLGILNVVMVIIGGVKAANGEYFRYPCTIRFLK